MTSPQNLLIMRHAKSSWNHEGLTDHQRPLNERGRRAAAAIGGVLRAKKLLPDMVWSSDSQRTRDTAEGLKIDKQSALYLPEFYHAPANKVLYTCDKLGEPDVQTLMLLGHNPGWEDLVYHFSAVARRMPTGACAIFKRTKTRADWLSDDSWRLADLLLPRDFE